MTTGLRRFVPSLVSLALAGVFWWFGNVGRAIGLIAVSALVAVLVLGGVDVVRRLSMVASAIVAAVTAALSWAVGVFVFVPVWAACRMLRRDPLEAHGQRGRSAGGWRALESPEPRAARPRGVTSRAVGVVGVLTLALLADMGAGWAWSRTVGSQMSISLGGAPLNLTGASLARDPRADSPAMAQYAWADEYFEEFRQVQSSYWPYLAIRERPVSGRFINVDGWERRSWQAPGVAADRPVVAFYGGSTTWGEGQRDEHTIASELSRIAAEEGLAFVARNHGQRGWTNLQEMLLFEQHVAGADPPDLAVFYDGLNEVGVQAEGPIRGEPSHYSAEEYSQSISGRGLVEDDPPTAGPRFPLAELVDLYTSHSLVMKGVRRVVTGGSGPLDQADAGTDLRRDAEARHGVASVYRRGRSLIEDIARRSGSVAVFYWQPTMSASEPEYRDLAGMVGSPTIDISESLEGRHDVFIDGGHTNEDGARLVAEAMWPTLRLHLEEWYGAS